MEINGEIIVIQRKKEVKPKLLKIYKRGCLDVHTPSSVNVKNILKPAIMILEMVYNIFSEKSLKSNLLHEHLIKVDDILNDKIIHPFLQVLFSLNDRTIQKEFQNDLGHLSESKKLSSSTASCRTWYYDSNQLASIIRSSRI